MHIEQQQSNTRWAPNSTVRTTTTTWQFKKDSPCLISPNRYASYFQTSYNSQSPQSTAKSAEQLIRMVLYTATL